MALYAFDGTGDRWDPPGIRIDRLDLHRLTEAQRGELLASITPTARNSKQRFLTHVPFFFKRVVAAGQHAEYFPGVGSGAWFETDLGQTLDFAIGGLFGVGARGIVRSALQRLKRNIKTHNDATIDIVGYSRGAAIACLFARESCRQFRQLELEAPPTIRFVALMDTVASFGNPFNDNELFFEPVLPFTVTHAVHAMAYDHNRLGFGLDRVYGNHVMEVWFRGGHGDIGGNATLSDGQPNRLRTNIVFQFICRKAKAAGVAINLDQLEGDHPVDFDAPLSVLKREPPPLRPQGELDPSRQIRRADILHHSIFQGEQPRVLIDAHRGIAVNTNKPLDVRSHYVIEEAFNELQTQDQRLLQLTPELSKAYPRTQDVYAALDRARPR